MKYSRYLTASVFMVACSPLALAFGPGELFITNYDANTVTVYHRTVSGTAVPLRTISTGLSSPFGVFVDQLFNEVYVTNNCRSAACEATGLLGSVQVYDLNANYPNDAPKRTIIGLNTGLIHSTGLTLDILRGELYVANDEGKSITVFPRLANGNVTPTRTIAGSLTALDDPLAVTLDLFHDEIIVVGGEITVYPRASNGNVAPKRTITGVQAGFNLPIGMSLDLFHDEFAVTNADANSILIFPRTANGNVSPSRTLQGSSTGLCIPSGVVLDPVFNEMVVSNSGLGSNGCSQSVTVYQRSASGNQSPIRTVNVGVATGPVSLAETLISFQ